jgi:hypothetical protein
MMALVYLMDDVWDEIAITMAMMRSTRASQTNRTLAK